MSSPPPSSRISSTVATVALVATVLSVSLIVPMTQVGNRMLVDLVGLQGIGSWGIPYLDYEEITEDEVAGLNTTEEAAELVVRAHSISASRLPKGAKRPSPKPAKEEEDYLGSPFSPVPKPSPGQSIPLHEEQLGNTVVGARPVPPNFVSVSLEVPFAKLLLSKKAYRTLMGNLQAFSNRAGPNIRIGGNSGDQAQFIMSNGTLYNKGRYYITEQDVAMYAEALDSFSGGLTIGLSMKYELQHQAAVAHMRAAFTHLPKHILDNLCINLSNEPDRFVLMKYRRHVSFHLYMNEAKALAADLKRAGVMAPCITGMGTSGSRWRENIREYLRTPLGEAKRVLDVHNYGWGGCHHRIPPALLLSAVSISRSMDVFRPVAALARKGKVDFIVGEGNSVTCSGQRGVSDTIVAVPWTVDTLLTFAKLGAQRYHLHGGVSYPYNTVTFPIPPGYPKDGSRPQSVFINDTSYDWPDVRPGYYGMWLVAFATRHSSHFLDSKIFSTPTRAMEQAATSMAGLARGTREVYVRSFSLRDQGGRTRYVVVHKGVGEGAVGIRILAPPEGFNAYNEAGQKVRVPAPAEATLLRCWAPRNSYNWAAQKGIRVANMTFDYSKSGVIRGNFAPETVELKSFPKTSQHGASRGYEFLLHPAQVIVVEFASPAQVAASLGVKL